MYIKNFKSLRTFCKKWRCFKGFIKKVHRFFNPVLCVYRLHNCALLCTIRKYNIITRITRLGLYLMLATASIKIFDVVAVATTSNVFNVRVRSTRILNIIIPVEGEVLCIIKCEYSVTTAIVTTLWVLSSRHYEYLVDDAIMYTRIL